MKQVLLACGICLTVVSTLPLPSLAKTNATGPALSVNVAANRKPISPLIYGMNFADEALAKELALPLNRWGGNRHYSLQLQDRHR